MGTINNKIHSKYNSSYWLLCWKHMLILFVKIIKKIFHLSIKHFWQQLKGNFMRPYYNSDKGRDFFKGQALQTSCSKLCPRNVSEIKVESTNIFKIELYFLILHHLKFVDIFASLQLSERPGSVWIVGFHEKSMTQKRSKQDNMFEEKYSKMKDKFRYNISHYNPKSICKFDEKNTDNKNKLGYLIWRSISRSTFRLKTVTEYLPTNSKILEFGNPDKNFPAKT